MGQDKIRQIWPETSLKDATRISNSDSKSVQSSYRAFILFVGTSGSVLILYKQHIF